MNIYLPDELGERVKAAHLEVSQICQAALSREVEQREASRKAKHGPYSRIEVEVGGKGAPTVRKAFSGRWLVNMKESQDESHENTKWSIALTRRGAFAVYTDHNDGERRAFSVFNSLAEAFEETRTGDPAVPEDVLAAANAALGLKTVIELDI